MIRVSVWLGWRPMKGGAHQTMHKLIVAMA